jgi:PIN domain nuclease of toxin-antitoxin system
MAAVAHLDTHVVVWLYAGALANIPRAVQALLEDHDLQVSPIVALELSYLHEIKRLKHDASTVLVDLGGRIGLRESQAEFAHVVRSATNLRWTRDPFDRLIVGNAIADGVLLLTADAILRKHYKRARWG